MMAGIPAVLLLVETEQRKIYHPEEIETVGGNRKPPLRFQNVRAVEPDFAKDFAGGEPLIRGAALRTAGVQRSSGDRPVRFAIRASILGPIS